MYMNRKANKTGKLLNNGRKRGGYTKHRGKYP